MTHATPKPITNEVIEGINDLLNSGARYVDHSSLQFRRLRRSIDSIKQLDIVDYHFCLAALYQIAGDVENSVYHMECAENLHLGPPRALDVPALYSNLGMFSEANRAARRYLSFECGKIGQLVHRCIPAFAFELMSELFLDADKMKIDSSQYDVVKGVANAVLSTLRNHNCTDADLAKWLDLSGDVLRENRVLFNGNGPELHVLGDNEELAVIWRLGVSSHEAADITMQLIDKIVDVDNYPSWLSVSFAEAEQ